MASGPEHYSIAEQLLAEADGVLRPNDEGHCEADRLIAAAQVHATLALAAATALGHLDEGMPLTDRDDWYNAASGQPYKV
jgi:hypothetical protein